MKIVINRRYGGFSLSNAAIMKFYELKGVPVYFYKQVKYKRRDEFDEWRKVENPAGEKDSTMLVTLTDYGYSFRKIPENFNPAPTYDIDRTDPCLIEIVNTMSELSNGKYANLEVIEIPDGIEYYIDDRDGIETVHAKHEYWPKDVRRRY